MDTIPNNPEKLTPQTEREMLSRQLAEAVPEHAKEIIKNHLDQAPEKVYSDNFIIDKDQIAVAAAQIKNPEFGQRREQIGSLLNMVESKGILPMASIIKNLPPDMEDEFHDLLISYLRGQEDIKNA